MARCASTTSHGTRPRRDPPDRRLPLVETTTFRRARFHVFLPRLPAPPTEPPSSLRLQETGFVDSAAGTRLAKALVVIKPSRDAKGARLMAFVVCEPCQDCKYTDCVTVCPMDCFYQDEEMLYIDPAECIDCEACVPECPVQAIFHEGNVPAPWTQFIQLNAERALTLNVSGGNITVRQEPEKRPGGPGWAD